MSEEASCYSHSIATPRKSIRMLFTAQDDDKLRSIISQIGTQDWVCVSKMMGNKSPRQCRDRYRNYLNPSLNRGKWTPEEDAILEEKIASIGPKWSQLAKYFNGRADVNIKNHWTQLNNRKRKIVTTKIIQPLQKVVVESCLLDRLKESAIQLPVDSKSN